jgi:D-sedoheptulose 7-phosphate isomerase
MSYQQSLAEDLFAAELSELQTALAATPLSCLESFHRLAKEVLQASSQGGTIYFCGNGGSAAECQHLAAELVVRYRRKRRGIASVALTTDSSILTACANDFAYEEVYARQIEALGKPGDVLICLSTSGTSPNITRAASVSKELGITTVLLTSERYQTFGKVGDYDIILSSPTQSVSVAQVIHLVMGHILCDVIETLLDQQSC